MTRPPLFLTVDHIIAIHRRVTDKFGGAGGLRDLALLESAAAMPAAQFGGRYLHPGIATKAAAYLFHLCRNHAFVDGNKRTALVAAEMFIILNGRSLSATDDELERLTVGVADGTVSKREAAAFFRRHVSR
jgi:death-on-curing protein